MSHNKLVEAEFNDHLVTMLNVDAGYVVPTGDDNLFWTQAGLTRTAATDGATDRMLLITGPSGAGKDSLKQSMLGLDDTLAVVTTATTRQQRPNEEDDAYVWMEGWPVDGLPTDDHVEKLVSEHSLIEYDIHHGNMYGLPEASLRATPEGKVPVLDIDIHGVKTIRERLGDEYLVRAVLVTPPSHAELLRRLQDNIRDNQSERLLAAVECIKLAPDLVDLIYVNTYEETYLDSLNMAARNIINYCI